jgi:hypothetical protein
MDNRSGVLMVQDAQQNIVALLCGVYQARSHEEQRSEIQDRYPNIDKAGCRALFEKDSRCRVHLERTPAGVPVVLSKRGARILTHKKLRDFETEHQCSRYPIPRTFLESLAETEHRQPWIQLTTKQKLHLLDVVAILYSFPRNQACQN